MVSKEPSHGYPGYTTISILPQHTFITFRRQKLRNKPDELNGSNNYLVYFFIGFRTEQLYKNMHWTNGPEKPSGLINAFDKKYCREFFTFSPEIYI